MAGAMPWSKFFWDDYAADPALKLCSFAAQGLWMRMLCIAAKHEPVGYVAVNGRGLDATGIARMTGGSVDEVTSLLDELESNGVFNRDRRQWIYSRRLVNDAKKSRNAHENGKLGGNPTLLEQRENSGEVNPKDKAGDKGRPKPQKPEARRTLSGSTRAGARPLDTFFPDGWTPEPFGKGTASRKIVDAWSPDERAERLEAFEAHHRAAASRFSDWQAAWKTWVLNSKRFAALDQRRSGAAPATGEPKSLAAQIIEEEERRLAREGAR